MNKVTKYEIQKGFTLVETLVGLAVFLVVATALYQVYAGVFSLTSANQYKILGLSLANEQFEIARNLPYSDVGEVSGVPNGKIPHTQQFVRGGVTFDVTNTIRNIDLPFDGTIGGSPNDLSPADNKLVEVEVSCSTCKGFSPITLTTTIAPKNLETTSTNGALFIKVFDADGQPVSNANVHITNTKIVPNITIDDVTDNNGMLQVVDAPPGIEAYAITVSKTGYSTDRTYATSTSNPNPAKPNATVVVQQITQVSFSIDKVSSVTYKSVGPTCEIIPNFNFSLIGSKIIGTNIPKYSGSLVTDSSGQYINNSVEWDSYNLTGTDSQYDIVGINPLNPINIEPNGTENINIITDTKNPRSLLVTVKDSSTGLPITGAIVNLTKTGYSSTKTTDRGYKSQTDWSGGSGFATFSSSTVYFSDDNNIDATSTLGEIKLKNTSGVYSGTGVLESSTIDIGSNSNFYKLTWLPTDEPVSTGTSSVRFQFASNTELTATTTWDFKGPDGTSSTFYTSSNNTISTVHNGGRYVRYKVYLSTASPTVTPNISDVSFTFATDCTPPGQVIFSGLDSGDYTLEIIKDGYSTITQTVSVTSNWQEQSIIMTP